MLGRGAEIKRTLSVALAGESRTSTNLSLIAQLSWCTATTNEVALLRFFIWELDPPLGVRGVSFGHGYASHLDEARIGQ